MADIVCDGLLNTEAICSYLGGCSRNTLYKWIQRGLPVIKEGPKEFSSSRSAIDEFFRRRTQEAAAKTATKPRRKKACQEKR